MIKEISSILDLVKQSSVFDLFLISFLALPFVLQAWINILKDLGNSPSQMLVGVIVVIIAYILGIVIMYAGVSRHRSKKLAKDQIVAYIKSLRELKPKTTMVRFVRLREKFGDNYSDQFLRSVIAEFPNELLPKTLKVTEKEEEGVGVLNWDASEGDEA